LHKFWLSAQTRAMKKVGLKIFVVVVAAFIILSSFNINFGVISSLPNTAIISTSDIKFLNENNIFGRFVQSSISDISVDNTQKKTAKMWIKLFGFIPIRQIEVELTKGEEVYVGGIPLGFSIKTQGLLVVGNNNIIADDGKTTTEKSGNILDGDIITKINGQEICDFSDITNIVENSTKPLNLTLLRGKKEIERTVEAELDIESGEKKIGLWVKNDTNGIGTLTYVKIADNRFGALGHAITDYETGTQIPVQSGKIYKCNQVGINKAEKNNPGELRCVFLQGINQKGTIDKNSKFGVFGHVDELSSVVDYNRTAEIGSRLGVKVGKASIISNVSGVREEYSIEIIKTSYQPEEDDKSFVFRVTDSRLLKLTGGILQGMSGSPIMQNGKLIGAITHVFVSDPTKGYGIYADWMAGQ